MITPKENKIYILIHSSATRADVDYTEQQLEQDHLARGINSPMGYHRYIRKSGLVVKGRKFGTIGAHEPIVNRHGIGICYEGGIAPGGHDWRDAADTRTEEQKAAILAQIRLAMQWCLSKFGKDIEFVITGHSQLPGVNKACPCFNAYLEYKWITS